MCLSYAPIYTVTICPDLPYEEKIQPEGHPAPVLIILTDNIIDDIHNSDFLF